MLISKKIDSYTPTAHCTYQLLETYVVGMGPKRIHSYSIGKFIDGHRHRYIIDGVKNKDAAFLIWKDVKTNIQK